MKFIIRFLETFLPLFVFLVLLGGVASAFGQQTATPASPQPDYINPDRPGFGSNSFTMGRGKFEIEMGLDYEIHDDLGVRNRQLYIPTSLRYGINDRFEVRLDTNGASLLDAGSTTIGYSPLGPGFKWHLLNPISAVRPSVAIIGNYYPKTGSSAFAATSPQADLALLVNYDLVKGGMYSMGPDFGIAESDNGNGKTFFNLFYAMTINYNPGPSANWFIGCGGQNPENENGRNRLEVDAGYAWVIGLNTQYDISFGTRVSGQNGAHPFLMVGYSYRF